VERADQADVSQALGPAALRAEWRGDLLGGVMTLMGSWANGQPMVAIPNYARMNRVGQVAAGSTNTAVEGPQSMVWIREHQ
jgi:hypothetical protein